MMSLVHSGIEVGLNNHQENNNTPFSFAAPNDDRDSRPNSSNESSSIGGSDDDDDEDEEDEENMSKESSFGSFSSSLEESLPIKRGLSSCFSGKTRSFTDLSRCANANVEDLAKPENAFNKRRRLLTSWSRRASCSSLIAVQEAKEKEEEANHNDDNEDNINSEGRGTTLSRGRDRNRKRKNGFRPSFSLSDLQHDV